MALVWNHWLWWGRTHVQQWGTSRLPPMAPSPSCRSGAIVRPSQSIVHGSPAARCYERRHGAMSGGAATAATSFKQQDGCPNSSPQINFYLIHKSISNHNLQINF
ncbi:hypothetical protein Lal_00039613 [Lupinus albus]|nr:hypothetical protein Lal_00039613 [Lupinus albus]